MDLALASNPLQDCTSTHQPACAVGHVATFPVAREGADHREVGDVSGSGQRSVWINTQNLVAREVERPRAAVLCDFKNIIALYRVQLN